MTPCNTRQISLHEVQQADLYLLGKGSPVRLTVEERELNQPLPTQ